MASDNHPGDRGTAVSTAGAATVNNVSCKITTEALTTANNAVYVFTLTNSLITPSSVVLASVSLGTSTGPLISIETIQVSAGTAVIRLFNGNAGALNGTLVISFIVF